MGVLDFNAAGGAGSQTKLPLCPWAHRADAVADWG